MQSKELENLEQEILQIKTSAEEIGIYLKGLGLLVKKSI